MADIKQSPKELTVDGIISRLFIPWNNPFQSFSYDEYVQINISKLLQKNSLTEEEEKWLCDVITNSF